MAEKRSGPVTYLAYLIRLRRDSESSPWRVTVENPHTGERRGFARLRQFVDFLEEQTGERSEESTE
jgi:hypothetical protein